ncbi:transposase [Streptomyces sp. NPDC018352]|uniref:transposase n=1 Tax=Streptomyces sp. NPDC018352 TaxID=3157194 RepID=UPI0033F203FC
MDSGAGRGGRPESYCHRVMLDAVRHVVDNGVKWASLPADFPPYRRVHAFARRWQATGLLAEFHDRLRDRVREKEGRAVDPTAVIVDSRSLRAAANIPRSTPGWDGGKKVGGRKRHVVVDCLGLVLAVAVTAAASRTAMPPSVCSSGCARDSSRSAWCGRTAAMPGGWSTGRPRTSAWSWRSSDAATTRRGGQRRVVGHIDGLPPGGAAQLLRGRGEAVRRTPAQDDLRSGGDGLVSHPQPGCPVRRRSGRPCGP